MQKLSQNLYEKILSSHHLSRLEKKGVIFQCFRDVETLRDEKSTRKSSCVTVRGVPPAVYPVRGVCCLGGVSSPPPKKGPESRGWRRDLRPEAGELRPETGVSLLLPHEQTHTQVCENITFHRTMYAGGKDAANDADTIMEFLEMKGQKQWHWWNKYVVFLSDCDQMCIEQCKYSLLIGIIYIFSVNKQTCNQSGKTSTFHWTI